MTLEDLSVYVLCERVRLIVCRLDKNHLDNSVFKKLANKMGTYINVLRSIAILGIVAEEDCSHIVTPDCDGVFHLDSKKLKQVLDEDDFSTNFTNSHVFCFGQ